MKSGSESESENRNSEPESGQSDSDNEITEEEEFRPVAVSLDLTAEYPTFAEFEKDMKRYGAATYQTFIKRWSEKLKANLSQGPARRINDMKNVKKSKK